MTASNTPRPLNHHSRLLTGGGALIAVLCLLPLLTGIVVSFQGGGTAYTQSFAHGRGWRLLADSMLFAVGGALFTLLLALAIALASQRCHAGIAIAALVLAALPLLIPSSLYAAGWIMALGREGVLTVLLRDTFGLDGATVYERPVAACLTALRYLAPAAAILMLAANRADRDWPAARALDLPALTRWRSLILPRLILPAAIAFVITFILILNDPILPGMFLVATYAGRIIVQYNALFDPAGAAALATPAVIIGGAITLVILRAAKHLRATQPSAASRPRVIAIRQVSASILLLVILFALTGVPLVALAVRAQSPNTLADALSQARDELSHTLMLMLLGGLLCTIAGWCLAQCWQRASRAHRLAISSFTLINLFVPPALLAIGVLSFFTHWPFILLRDSDLPLLLGYLARWSPLTMLILLTDQSHLTRHATLAAVAHGVPTWSCWWRITLPMRLPAVLLAFLAGALLIAIELELSVLLVQPGRATLGVRLYTMIHTAPDALVSALALDIILLAMPLLLLVATFGALWHRRHAT